MQRRDGRPTKRDTGSGTEKWGDDRRRSRRELGQNFLKDRQIARRIVAESGAGRDDLVVELGAGGGMLTRQLARVARRVVAVEYDPYLALRLRERFSDVGNIHVVHEDALKVEFPEEPFTVVANVPSEVAACLMVAAKCGPPLVEPGHRHLFLALVRQAFEARGNSVGRVLWPAFTRTQLRRLAKDNRFTLDLPPSMLTVRQWTSLSDFMVRMVPQDRWPHAKQHARREQPR